VKDTLGRVINLSKPPRRLLSLSPATTENLFAIGAGAYLVGRTTACDYPKECVRIASVGDFYRPSIERIFTLAPDLVVLDSNTIDLAGADDLQKRLKTPIFVFQTKHYADIATQLSTLASWFDTPSVRRETKAQQAILTRAAQTAQMHAQKQHAKPNKSALRAFIEINETPLYGVGTGAFVADILRLLGLQNAVPSPTAYPQISREQLFTYNPDVYIIAQPTGQPTSQKRVFTAPLNTIKAVQTGCVYTVPADQLLRPTPRLALGLETLAQLLQK
jgi:ABC-type Fe3+-hydroxamate transport system substrate-binding protein